MTRTLPSYDALQVGDVLPAFETEPISRLTLALYCGASGDHNPIHVDLDFARAAGQPDVFAHGMLSMAYLGRLLTNWVPQQALRRYGVRFVALTRVHDRITCRGTVVAKETVDGERRVRVEVSTVDQDGQVKLAGEAEIALA
ncbi:MaoC family dehydratase [Piscinibacter sakaiensis]|uniref:MaoC family protein n=1 Tax=Piscinibacter sakaiensis TaxID=1547922 RepID=A0A0K8P3R1_PISS1|nr:MaoC family dehydratase [Piscinibacter sakaiensis]GAP37211.1 MaoC family protein [Piscinibacter sakaiensis]